MKKLLSLLALGATLSFGVAHAQTCDAQAADKKLNGAAKTSFVKKCEKDAKAAMSATCATKAIDKNGKPLAGAAKNSFMKKCEADAKG
ncbi:MAG: hypothetical protein J7605_23490 [Variovorax sp.]|nr:hypothetical protein [Variovorax sp.]